MSENLCLRCGKPMPDTAYACVQCGVTKPGEQLRQIVDMVPAARDIAHGLSRRGGGGASSGKPGSQLPLDLTATSKLDAVQVALTTWARHVAEERGILPPFAIRDLAAFDPILKAAEFLAKPEHLDWMRHRAEVDEFLADVQAAARVVAGIARGPASLRYLGPCGAIGECNPIRCAPDCPPGCGVTEPICDGDIYAREGASDGRCRLCGATVATAERRAWLDAEVRSSAFRAAQIAEAYGVNADTIRSWAHRGQLVAHGHDRDGRPLYNVGEVLDLAQADAVRRHEQQVKRARRAAAKAVETGDAA